MSFANVENKGFSFTANIGDSSVLLAFNLAEEKIKNLAGFAIHCITPKDPTYKTNSYYLKNRLNFKKEIASNEEFTPDKWTYSNIAPFQSFHWAHFPGAGPGDYTYSVYPCYFGTSKLEKGENLSLKINLNYKVFKDLEVGLTRGYISSQAYADKFENKPISPKKKSIDYDTSEYEEAYKWLGAHARKMVYEFLDECVKDPAITLDVFVFDLDEVKIIKSLCDMGSRLQIYMDNSKSHTEKSAMEPLAKDAMEKTHAQIKEGHFGRLSHDKVLIKKKNGVATQVLTGSMNFTIRGIYVQSNNVLIFDNPEIAGLYEQAFKEAFTNPSDFRKAEISSKWFDTKINQNVPVSFSFAPHTKAFPLQTVADAITSAETSVMFSMMETASSGVAMDALKNLGNNDKILSLGVIQKKSELDMFKQGIKTGYAPFSYLKEQIPNQFKAEWSGGSGQVIHHKFVVCDFNGKSPVVFCGSSNFAEGGEKSNGDNLIAIHDPRVATIYAIEAIRMYDHYRFRSLQENKTKPTEPLILDSTDTWTKRYYDPNDYKYFERNLLCPPKK